MACGYGSCGGGYSSGGGCGYTPNYSALEETVSKYEPTVMMSAESSVEQPVFQAVEMKTYTSSKYDEGKYLSRNASPKLYFTPSVFLNDVPTEFISSNDDQQNAELMSFVNEAFEAATGEEFPQGMKITVCSKERLKATHEAHGGKWNEGVSGFSINRRGFGVSEIFVKEDELARLMLTIGHEIGHVIALPLGNAVDEEAKAFAFSMQWMEAVRKNNIGGLYEAINPNPAKNGLHNKAFDFVISLIEQGRKAVDVYLGLIKGDISIKNTI